MSEPTPACLAATDAFEADGRPRTLHPRPCSALQFTQNLIINGDNSSDDARGIGCHQLRARTHPTKELCEHTALASHDRYPSARLWQGTGKSATRRPFSRSSALNLPRVTSALLIASASSWAPNDHGRRNEVCAFVDEVIAHGFAQSRRAPLLILHDSIVKLSWRTMRLDETAMQPPASQRRSLRAR